MIEDQGRDSSAPSVVFVVVNWNQRQLTLDCLASLRKQRYCNFTVTLVDNGSQDNSVSAVLESFPEVTILRNSSNIGIAGANNVGIRYALRKRADYVFLLNNDTTVDPDMLRRLVAVAEAEPQIGMTGPTMLYFDQPDVIWCAGNSIDWRSGNTTRLRADSHRSSLDSSTTYAVDFITSCAVCIKSSVFESVGMMDERYFIYYDETDWFARATKKGWKTIYVPQALMWHKVSAAMGTSSPATEYYMSRNVLRFLAKNMAGRDRLISLARAIGHNLRTIAAYTAKSHNGLRIPHRNSRLLALRDALRSRWGVMGQDVARVCYPGR